MSITTLPRSKQHGIALVTSLLLLLIITIIALSMFRSFAVQERIAGNTREKDRALHAAETAQQYGEWWLTQGNNVTVGAVPCAAGVLNANNNNEGQICTQTPLQQIGATWLTAFPWATQIEYLPPGMCTAPAVTCPPNGDPAYAMEPAFWITDVGPAGDGMGEAYQIDAYGFGSVAANLASTTIAVVESIYEVQQGVSCRSCQ